MHRIPSRRAVLIAFALLLLGLAACTRSGTGRRPGSGEGMAPAERSCAELTAELDRLRRDPAAAACTRDPDCVCSLHETSCGLMLSHAGIERYRKTFAEAEQRRCGYPIDKCVEPGCDPSAPRCVRGRCGR